MRELQITAALVAFNVVLAAAVSGNYGELAPALTWVALGAITQWVLFAERLFPDVRELRAMAPCRWGSILGFAVQEPPWQPPMRQRLEPNLTVRAIAVGLAAFVLLISDSPARAFLWGAPFWVVVASILLGAAYLGDRLYGPVLISLIHLWRATAAASSAHSGWMLGGVLLSAVELAAFAWWLRESMNARRHPGAPPDRMAGGIGAIAQLAALSLFFFWVLPKDSPALPPPPVKGNSALLERQLQSRLNRGHRPGGGGGGSESARGSGGKGEGAGERGTGSGGGGERTKQDSMSPPGSKGSGLGQNQTAQPTGREPDQKLPPERGQDPKPKAARETDQESPRNAEPGKEGESGSTQPGESAPDGERPAAASPPRPPDWDLKTGLQIALLALFLGGALLLARKVKRKRSAKRPPPLRAARRVSRRQRQTALDRLKARCQSLLKGDADERTRRERVILLYNSLLDFLETCGHGKPSHVTPDEFSEQLGAPEPSELSFDAATRIFSRACYGGKGPSPEHYQRFAKNVPRLAESLARLESRAAK